MRWLITGGCGFIGTRLIHALNAEGGHRIRAVDNLVGGARDDLARITEFADVPAAAIRPMDKVVGPTVELIEGDVIDGPLMFKAAAGADVVMHLAASAGTDSSVEDPALDCTVNVFGTLNMLEAARHNKVPRFVFASSLASLGDGESPLHEGQPPRPVSPFGASKLAGEGYCSAYYWSCGMDTVALRFDRVYGPGASESADVVTKFIRRALAGERLEIRGDSRHACDFLFVDDVVRALRLAATREGVGGETLQITTGNTVTIGELAEELMPVFSEAGLSAVAIHRAAPSVGNVEHGSSGASKARDLLGWWAETSLSDGLRRTVAWIMEQSRARARAAAR